MEDHELKELIELRNKVRVLESCTLSTLAQGHKNIDRCSRDKYRGSAVTICIRNINLERNTLVKEVQIPGGLSHDTIKCIKNDIRRAYDEALNSPMCTISTSEK